MRIEGLGNITNLPKKTTFNRAEGETGASRGSVAPKNCGNMSPFTESGTNGRGPRSLGS